MKNLFRLVAVISFLLLTVNCWGATDDLPLLSQGALIPPPPPPAYTGSNSTEPLAGIPQPPILPPKPVVTPPSATFKTLLPTTNVKQIYGITKENATKISRLMRSLYTFREIIDKPTNGQKLRRIINIGRVCSEILGLVHFPAPTKFRVSSGDRVIRDRSYGAVEYRHFGDFDHRLNGWVKPINTAVYADLVFTSRDNRRNHIKAQLTRNGTMEGIFYAYSWDKYGRAWKLQGTIENLLCRDNGLPSIGKLELMGADPSGKTMKYSLDFPVKIINEKESSKKEIRHREGRPVHIGH
jgi:hypothetical protein